MVAISPEQSVPQESRNKKTPDTVKIEKYSEVWEHAKNLEGKIKKLKEHAIDADEIGEIEGILKDAKGYFSRFGEKKDKGRSVAQLEERRKAAVEKLTDLNRRMVSMLEKLGQPIPNTFLSYKDSGFVDIVKESNKERLSEEKKEEVSEVVGVHIIQPPENYSKESLGDSEIGGVNSIEAPEKKEEVLVSAEESPVNVREESSSPETPIEDVIKISSGGKTYEFGWHEQVVYTTAKGKQLDCIVLGKSKDENKSGLILKDLEKGKVFALGADAVAKRVRISDGETVSPSAENNKADSGQSTEDEDIFGLKDQPKKEETQWPESREESMDEMIQSARAAIEDEDFKKMKSSKKEELKKNTEDEDFFGLKDQSKGEEVKWPESYYAKEESLEKMIADAKVDVESEMDQKIEEYRRKSKKEKYAAELQLPSVIVNKEFLTRADKVEKGEIQTPTVERKNVPDLPSVMVDEEYQKYRPPLASRERKTYPEVSEKQALKMIDSIDEALEKAWGGMRMMTTEKQKTGWFRSKQVEREMTDEERKAQLEAWLDTVEQAFDSLDKKKEGTNLEKPVLAWHKAQTLMRKLGIELGQVGKEIQNVEFKRAFNTMNAEVVEAGVRLEEKKEKRDGGKSRIPNWARRTILGTLGALAIGNVETNRVPEVVAAAEIHSEEAPRKENVIVETTGESQRTMLNFLTDVNKMMTEDALSETSFVVDSGLASEIKSGKEAKVPGLMGVEISSDGKSVTLTFDNNKKVQSRPEKVRKAGSDSWKLKVIEKKGPEYGEQVLRELRQVLGEVKQEFPDVFRGPESPSKQKKMVRTVVQAEKKLREVEVMIPRSGEARRQLEQVKQVMEEVRPGLESVSKKIVDEIEAEDLNLPEDVFIRFGVKTSEDPEAGRLAQAWSEADKALKSAKESGNAGEIQKRTTEVKKILEEIKSKY